MPADSRHIILEIPAAASAPGDELVTVQLTSNDDEPNYVNRWLYAEGEDLVTEVNDAATTAQIMRTPRSDAGSYGVGELCIPLAFLHDQSKHVLTMAGAGHRHVSTNMSHWNSRDSIGSIRLRTVEGLDFAAGSAFRLCAVDESYRVRGALTSNNQSEV